MTTLGHGEPDRSGDDIGDHDVVLLLLPAVHDRLLRLSGHGAVDGADPQASLHEVLHDAFTDVGVGGEHQHGLVVSSLGGIKGQLNLRDDCVNLRLANETAQFLNTDEGFSLHHGLSLGVTTSVNEPLLKVLFGTLVLACPLALQLTVTEDATHVRQVCDDIGGADTVRPASDWVEHLSVQVFSERLTTGTVGIHCWGEVVKPCAGVADNAVNVVAVKGGETLHEVPQADTSLRERGARQEPLRHLWATCAEVVERTTTTRTLAGDTLTLVNDESTHALTEVTDEVVGDDAVAEVILGVLVIPCELLRPADEPAVVPSERAIGGDDDIGIGETLSVGLLGVQWLALVEDGGGQLRCPLRKLLLPVPSEGWRADNEHWANASVVCGLGEHDARDGLTSALLVSDEVGALTHCTPNDFGLMGHEVCMECRLHGCHGQAVAVPWG